MIAYRHKEEIRKLAQHKDFAGGGEYLAFVDDELHKRGYRYTGAACDCPDGGEHGHEPFCGYGIT